MSPKTVILFLALLGVVAASNLRHAKTESDGCIDDEAHFKVMCAHHREKEGEKGCPVDFTCPMAAKHGQCGEHGGHVTRVCCKSCRQASRHEEISDHYQDKHEVIDAAHADIDAKEEALMMAHNKLSKAIKDLKDHHETRMEDFDEEEKEVVEDGEDEKKDVDDIVGEAVEAIGLKRKKFEEDIKERLNDHHDDRDAVKEAHDNLGEDRDELDNERADLLHDEQDAEHAKVAGGPDFKKIASDAKNNGNPCFKAGGGGSLPGACAFTNAVDLCTGSVNHEDQSKCQACGDCMDPSKGQGGGTATSL